jgi:Cof subfamily protein (haloacid dehalogenase superfamily)
MIRLVLCDLDGTLITSKRELTEATRRAVRDLAEAGIGFTLVSGRPPLGMRFFARDLDLKSPFAAFNGGMLVRPDLSVLEELDLDPGVAGRTLQRLGEMGLDSWIYQGQEWLVRDLATPHLARERDTVRIEPKVVASFGPRPERVVKIVGISDDHGLVERAERELRSDERGAVVAARSQNYYLDVTHPDANKGSVVLRLAKNLGISPAEVATLGDMPSDVAMFGRSGVSFAMGNASDSVKEQATHVVASNDQDGFAQAIGWLLEGSRSASGGRIASS